MPTSAPTRVRGNLIFQITCRLAPEASEKIADMISLILMDNAPTLKLSTIPPRATIANITKINALHSRRLRTPLLENNFLFNIAIDLRIHYFCHIFY